MRNLDQDRCQHRQACRTVLSDRPSLSWAPRIWLSPAELTEGVASVGVKLSKLWQMPPPNPRAGGTLLLGSERLGEQEEVVMLNSTYSTALLFVAAIFVLSPLRLE